MLNSIYFTLFLLANLTLTFSLNNVVFLINFLVLIALLSFLLLLFNYNYVFITLFILIAYTSIIIILFLVNGLLTMYSLSFKYNSTSNDFALLINYWIVQHCFSFNFTSFYLVCLYFVLIALLDLIFLFALFYYILFALFRPLFTLFTLLRFNSFYLFVSFNTSALDSLLFLFFPLNFTLYNNKMNALCIRSFNINFRFIMFSYIILILISLRCVESS